MSSPRLTTGRFSEHGLIYSITTVCYRRYPLFLDTSAVDAVAEELQRISQDRVVENYAWVLMPNHLHWLFLLREGTLAHCMQLLKGRSARSINRLRAGNSTVWQAGYFNHAVRRDDCVQRHARYIVENPIRSGLAAVVGDYAHAWCAWDIT